MIYHNLYCRKYQHFGRMHDKDFLKKIGANIARIRKEKSLTQMDLSALIDMEKSNISTIENGRQNPSALTLKKIADAIGCEVREFFEV